MSEEKRNETISSDIGPQKSSVGPLLCYALIACFLFLTAGAGIFTLAVKDKDFSQAENRMLSQKPHFSLSALFDGSFMADFESWLSDQFPLRDEAISLKTDFDRLSGKKEENDVIIGTSNRLFEYPTEYDAEKTKEKTDAISSFLGAHPEINTIVAVVPNSSFIYSEDLPRHLTLSNQQKQIDSIYSSLSSDSLTVLDTIPVILQMKNSGTELYYKTDHHWTTRTAFGVYLQIAESWQFDADTEYSFYPVTDYFEGTLASKSGVHDTKDVIEICVPEDSVESYTVNYESIGIKTATLFHEEKLEAKNKYEVFLGGNYDKVSIETTAPNNNTLLIIKDSYANCMIPMLTPHFSRIVIVDPRYMSESMETVMSEYSFTHMLMLYNLNTFNDDTSLTDVLKNN